MKHFHKTTIAIAAITATIISQSACRKKVPPVRQPTLSAPERMFSSSTKTQQPISAEIEVKASSGPVELNLGLYKTKVNQGYPRFRVRLKNIGKNKMRVLTEAFSDPFVIQKNDEYNHTGIYLEVLNSAGETPSLRRRGDMPLKGPLPQSILTKKDHAEIETWEKQGISSKELGIKVTELIYRNHPSVNADPPAIWMEPGASTATTAWLSQEATVAYPGNPEHKIIGDFAQLSRYYLPPGKYRIRAVYNAWLPPGYFSAGSHLKPDEWNVLVKTPVIDFEVLP